MVWKSAAIQVDPGLGTAERVMMQGARDQFFAAAALASDQYRSIALRYLDHQLHQFLHGGAGDDGGKAQVRLGPQRLVFGLGAVRTGKRRNLFVRLRAPSSSHVLLRIGPSGSELLARYSNIVITFHFEMQDL